MSQQPPEQDRRTARKILRAKSAYMSNAKWRKLFRALHDCPGGCQAIGVKLIGRTVLSVPPPGPDFAFDDHFGECGGISFVPFSQIEFVGISNSRMSNADLVAHLERRGVRTGIDLEALERSVQLAGRVFPG